MSGFKKATKKAVKLKLAITGPTGSGKTYSALSLAKGLGERVAVIDTENGSASLYSDRFGFDVMTIDAPFEDDKFIAGINEAISAGYDVLVIDSASHCWEGVLEFKAKMDARGGNSYTNWNQAGNKLKSIINAVLRSPIHVICCMRSKMDYVIEQNEKGKSTPRKVGLAPIMRDGIEYEFTTIFDLDMTHHAEASKDRTGMFDGKLEVITQEHGKRFLDWLDGAEAVDHVAEFNATRDLQDEKARFFQFMAELYDKDEAKRLIVNKAQELHAKSTVDSIEELDAIKAGIEEDSNE